MFLVVKNMIENSLLVILHRNQVERSPCNFDGKKGKVIRNSHDRGKNTDSPIKRSGLES